MPGGPFWGFILVPVLHFGLRLGAGGPFLGLWCR